MFFRSIILIGLVCALSFISCSEGRQSKELRMALQMAGENRPELERVMDHYSLHPQDSLKLKAAVFLIENMPYHYSYAGTASMNKFYDRIDSAYLFYRDKPEHIKDSIYTTTTSQS